MTPKRRTLGRGLDALLSTAQPETGPNSTAPTDQNLRNLPVDLLERGRYQPRLDMRPETLEELAESIRSIGLLHAPTSAITMSACVAASASFSPPIGYQTSLIVQSIGNYKFSDYWKIGLPLNILALIISLIVIPRFWPF